MTDSDQNDVHELKLDPVDADAEAPEAAEAEAADSEAADSEAAEAEAPAPEVAEAVVEVPASGSAAVGAADTAAGAASDDGQWVWQYGAPPPPPPFSATFFSGTALPELYRFFACGLLVVIGCFLPWGPVSESGLAEGDEAVVETLMSVPDVIGVETGLGALSLVIGLWLMFSSCYSIYTRRQKILPVFLMLEPAIVCWLRVLDAHGKAGNMGIGEMIDAAGTGVLMTLVGSTLVSIQFFFVVAKVYTKKDGKDAPRRSAKDGSKDKGGPKGKRGPKGKGKGKGKDRSKNKGKGKGKDEDKDKDKDEPKEKKSAAASMLALSPSGKGRRGRLGR